VVYGRISGGQRTSYVLEAGLEGNLADESNNPSDLYGIDERDYLN
jgi:hypothetical protein